MKMVRENQTGQCGRIYTEQQLAEGAWIQILMSLKKRRIVN
jgi:hypothetical protein